MWQAAPQAWHTACRCLETVREEGRSCTKGQMDNGCLPGPQSSAPWLGMPKHPEAEGKQWSLARPWPLDLSSSGP